MAFEFTLEKLKAISPDQRLTVYSNAQKQNTPEAKAVIDLLLSNDLLIQIGGGYPREHPTIREMEEFIQSEDCRKSARAASDSGLPAMAGVDPLLQKRFGAKYGPADTTSWAGTFVADQMRTMGYNKVADSRPLPTDCVAKTAALFAPNIKGPLRAATVSGL